MAQYKRGIALDAWAQRLADERASRAHISNQPQADDARQPEQRQQERDLIELDMLAFACAKERYLAFDYPLFIGDPSLFSGPFDLSPYLAPSPLAPVERAQLLTRYLDDVPAMLAQVMARLIDAPLSAPLVRGSIWTYSALLVQYRSLADGETISPFAASAAKPDPLAGYPAEALALRRALSTAIAALEHFIAWLGEQNKLLPDAGVAPAGMGALALARTLRMTLLEDTPLDTLIAQGEADLAKNVALASEIAGRMGLGDRPLRDAFAWLDTPAATASHATKTKRAIERSARVVACDAIAALRTFIREHDLLPDALTQGEIAVDYKPSFLSGPYALIEPPGVFADASLAPRFYLPRAPRGRIARVVSITHPISVRDHTDERLFAWHTRMLPWALRTTAAHETIPGHAVFFQALRHAPSLAARVFRSDGAIEGWAHYAEQLARDEHFGADDPRNTLANLRAAIHRNCRFLVALRLHIGALTLDEAITFIVEQTSVTPFLARHDAWRCLRDPMCVSYTLGKLRLLKLRDDYARQEGERFTLKRFHEAVLAQGQLPIPLLRRALLHT